MIDLQEATGVLYEELIAYLQDAPINITTEIHYDTLWELCYDEVINRLADAAEAAAEEKKLKDVV